LPLTLVLGVKIHPAVLVMPLAIVLLVVFAAGMGLFLCRGGLLS